MTAAETYYYRGGGNKSVKKGNRGFWIIFVLVAFGVATLTWYVYVKDAAFVKACSQVQGHVVHDTGGVRCVDKYGKVLSRR